jgi:UDP-N-acetylglucosamine 1-carboxyvinyltransferase
MPASHAVQFVVEGGHQLSGSIRPSGNKNAALPIVASALSPSTR